ncbi:hypothetical protein C8P68_10156 [Mucilaginibacter yixingensis]|uniref:Uncharacterized protein n=1 Tax=Mucilaginibacter yixingensis TaxID=1295612 RepID=A0A2T5JEJ4_9SPHI|nr:hypothetical protein [Mucilaginibacter yixingensis]PTR00829.1 hypothetical protein C8P68_10156 [Mucilaginibacter yixingensis]
MRAGVLQLLLLLLSFVAPAQSLPKVRAAFVRALNSKQVTDSLYNSLSKAKDKSPILVAYTGSANAMRALHTWNPYFKIKYVGDAEQCFSTAVQQDPHNIEIRFLRFSMEHYVPGFLGFSKNLQADKVEIITQLRAGHHGTADAVTVKTIMEFLAQSKRCTVQEDEFLKRQLSLLK